jgi:glycosyltransferase involved in cell wall biosynthesis
MNRASWVGFQSGAAKRQLIEQCTALVVPSVWWEPLGLVLYEAYDFGKPVLAARSGGIVDHVQDQVTGWLHEPHEAQTLASQMIEAATCPEKCRAMGLQGRLRLKERNTHVWIEEFDDFVGGIVRDSKDRKRNPVASAVQEPRHKQGRAPSPGEHAGEMPDDAGRDAAPGRPGEWDGNGNAIDTPSVAFHARGAPGPSSRGYAGQADSALPGDGPGGARPTETPNLRISIYLADQNPGYDRSFGISRMSQVILTALEKSGSVRITSVVSRTSQQPPADTGLVRQLPLGTRRKSVRLLADHLHPLFQDIDTEPELYYYPKGYLPLLHQFCRPSVVTIHDTIIQYDEDHYPKWRKPWEYAYWSWLLRHTLRHADRIMTVSESSKRQIQGFMRRHGIPSQEITVTYEPCAYEELLQPEMPSKDNHVIHLASREPHKRTAHLVRWWHEAETLGRDLPALHLIGSVPPEVEDLLASTRTIVKRPFLNDTALQAAYQQAGALILPSEIEGFGLPALEAYYLGTPVCYVMGTSVEEVLAVATSKGGFALDDMESLFTALDEVMAMPPEEVRSCGLKLRETYAAEKVVERMLSVFHDVKN